MCWKATEQVIQVMQNYVHCLNLHQLTASQQNMDHVANVQISAQRENSSMDCCGIVFVKDRPSTITCSLGCG